MTNITLTKCLGEQMKNEDIKTHAKIKIHIMGLQVFLFYIRIPSYILVSVSYSVMSDSLLPHGL